MKDEDHLEFRADYISQVEPAARKSKTSACFVSEHEDCADVTGRISVLSGAVIKQTNKQSNWQEEGFI